MTLDGAIAASTAMMAAAFVQQSAEHLRPAARAAERTASERCSSSCSNATRSTTLPRSKQ